MTSPRRHRLLSGAAAVVLATLLAACGGTTSTSGTSTGPAAPTAVAGGYGGSASPPPATTTAAPATTPPPATTAPATPPPATGSVTVYFANGSGRLVAEQRARPAGVAALDAAMAALAAGPRAAGLVSALPAGTRVLSTGVANGAAQVNFSSQFVTGYPSGGSAAELAIVAPVVHTATRAAGVGRVRILVDGRAPAPVGSQIDFSQPLSVRDVPTGG